MSNDIFDQILKDHKELSSLPHTLTEVLRVIRDDDSSASDLADVLVRDPAMTAKILRVVNSPFYGAGREITTMPRAVMTLGHRAISALALSTSVYDMTGKWESTIDRKRFWRHSLEVALASRLVAEKVGYEHPEEAFIFGLLHDIGILVLERSFSEKFDRIWKRAEAGARISDLEEEVWGTNHARVGQFLLEQWGVPSVICDAVGQHHNDLLYQTSDPEFRPFQIVALANSISQFTIASARPDVAVDIEKRDALVSRLEMSAEALAEVREELVTRVTEEAGFLEIDIGSPHEILVEANRMIYTHYLAVENLLRENRDMQNEIAQAQIEKASLDALKTIAATFNHYINNAAGTILGRAQLIELKATRGNIGDAQGEISSAMRIIIEGVNTICAVMEELKKLTKFEKAVYHDDMYIIDIENRLRNRVESLQNAVPKTETPSS